MLTNFILKLKVKKTPQQILKIKNNSLLQKNMLSEEKSIEWYFRAGLHEP